MFAHENSWQFELDRTQSDGVMVPFDVVVSWNGMWMTMGGRPFESRWCFLFWNEICLVDEADMLEPENILSVSIRGILWVQTIFR